MNARKTNAPPTLGLADLTVGKTYEFTLTNGLTRRLRVIAVRDTVQYPEFDLEIDGVLSDCPRSASVRKTAHFLRSAARKRTALTPIH